MDAAEEAKDLPAREPSVPSDQIQADVDVFWQLTYAPNLKRFQNNMALVVRHPPKHVQKPPRLCERVVAGLVIVLDLKVLEEPVRNRRKEFLTRPRTELL